jgi:hypothetical protein
VCLVQKVDLPFSQYCHGREDMKVAGTLSSYILLCANGKAAACEILLAAPRKVALWANFPVRRYTKRAGRSLSRTAA